MCCSLVSPQYKLQALLHDASEAYLLDIPSPIKNRLDKYKVIEHRLMILISQKFGFKYPLETYVKQIDAFMLRFEWDQLMVQDQLTEKLICQTPEYAKRDFLEKFNELVPL